MFEISSARNHKRASMSLTGLLHATPASLETIYAAALLSAIARICAALEPRWFGTLAGFGRLAWITAFWLFVVEYGPILFASRRV
ncbi:MAG: hypothetical protein JOZ84_17620 [Methylobacteriaceae bacterium]|nr:hypothetical protein [Methylobacteriaceae bacterium]MBV9396215.1 hypothetical protein [Methylobacteriaceae bacterium]